MKIALTKITLARHLLRRELAPDALEALAADMATHGQIQPIAVRPLPDGTYELIAGRRRLIAAQKLGWTEIEAYLLPWDGLAELPALSENLKRTNLSPLEEADAVHYLHIEQQLSVHEISEKTGHGTSWVQDRLALANYPENFKLAVHQKKLSISAAGMILRITDTEYRDYLLHIAGTNGCTIHQAEAWVLDWQARKRLLATDGWEGEVPQPPPPPPTPRQPCFFCEQELERELIMLVRICRECHGAAVDAKRAQPPTPTPAAPSTAAS